MCHILPENIRAQQLREVMGNLRGWQCIVSNHAARLITSVLTNTMARREDRGEDEQEKDASDVDEEVPAMQLKPVEFRELLWRACTQRNADGDEPNAKRRRKGARGTDDHSTALRQVEPLWAQSDSGSLNALSRTACGPMHSGNVKMHIEAKSRAAKENTADRPYTGKSQPAAMLYSEAVIGSVDVWLEGLSKRPKAPTRQQGEFLRSIG